MNIDLSDNIKKIINSDKEFSNKFHKLIMVFEKRIWTQETCFFFKKLCEDLFREYGLFININIKKNIYGEGVFEIFFIENNDEKSLVKYNKNLWQRIIDFFRKIFYHD